MAGRERPLANGGHCSRQQYLGDVFVCYRHRCHELEGVYVVVFSVLGYGELYLLAVIGVFSTAHIVAFARRQLHDIVCVSIYGGIHGVLAVYLATGPAGISHLECSAEVFVVEGIHAVAFVIELPCILYFPFVHATAEVNA